MALTEKRIANIIALNIMKAETVAADHTEKGNTYEADIQYAISASLRNLASELGVKNDYFDCFLKQLQGVDCE
ncbi:hypothetical protein [Cytobacillus oceanisediminis]|uniref:hypothetical protein n=1 Tax=Cytobacillus oceanisediminis TaxID=665099 RepID=UPI001FB3E30D|nr:hypothetical protein [Cytobacillus oceanisediminis]UOE58153.1 hypothetical protein IRB79_26980 [Cytobacillus oceanisediminis]